ncbi:hypothetical protein GRADUATION_97 [Mycobacterium phage Graduation]|uniref:hypothetical protein n=1 Tax=Mycobacterium phage Graduation TaxID=1391432 RepID=UPI0003C95BE6|nr:hypothetical protein GRADUATION_97 [Mycobacterium phage Graduation]AHB29793.1 hypothetical protein GRADUATION_97 [Mycobacterium phage Graduation]
MTTLVKFDGEKRFRKLRAGEVDLLNFEFVHPGPVHGNESTWYSQDYSRSVIVREV